MIEFNPTPVVEMERRARRTTAARRATSPASSLAAKNVEALFSIDATAFFSFRGRPYMVPPLPYRVGERLLELHTRAGEAGMRMQRAAAEDVIDRGALSDYFDALRQLPGVLWANCAPASRVLRLLRRLGVLRNPFRLANERELMEMTDFFLARRTRSGVQFLPEMGARRPRGTHSMRR